MKTVKLLLMIAALPAMIFLTTNCGNHADNSDLTIDRYKKCLDNCDEKRDRIDAGLQACIDEAFSQTALYERQIEICVRKWQGDRNEKDYIECTLDAWNRYSPDMDKLAECFLVWRERLEEVKECKKQCYKDAVSRKLP